MSLRALTRVWEESTANGGELLVHLALADYADSEGWAWPSVETLARKSRLSERAVQYALKKLSERGEIEVSAASGPRGVNRYRVLDPGGADFAGVQSERVILHPNRKQPSEDFELEPLPIPNPSRLLVIDYVAESFKAFWAKYPKNQHGRKVGKAAAQAVWQKLKPEDRELALSTVGNYALACEDGLYAKDAERWLSPKKRYFADWTEPPVTKTPKNNVDRAVDAIWEGVEANERSANGGDAGGPRYELPFDAMERKSS